MTAIIKWERIRKDTTEQGTNIRYGNAAIPGIVIESRKRRIPHSNKSGTWDHTTYFLIVEGKEKEYWSLKDAKEAAEKLAAEGATK